MLNLVAFLMLIPSTPSIELYGCDELNQGEILFVQDLNDIVQCDMYNWQSLVNGLDVNQGFK